MQGTDAPKDWPRLEASVLAKNYTDAHIHVCVNHEAKGLLSEAGGHPLPLDCIAAWGYTSPCL